MKNLRNHMHRLSRQLRGSKELFYVSDRENWVLRWVGHYITHEVQAQFGLKAHLDKDLKWAMPGDVLHFGSLWNTVAAFKASASRQMLDGKHNVATLFHGERGELHSLFNEAFDIALANIDSIARIVTANRIMQARLAEWGVPLEKIACIPLGVDLTRFQPASNEARRNQRSILGVPENAFCIGSFQKDGEGWDEGFKPKLIKGPDIFLEVVERLARHYPVFVLLTGPARGYVKVGLEKMRVPYHHTLLEDFLEIPHYYQCLDLYLITAREEGGPQAILEAPACGVPVISTRVGLAPDILTNGVSGILVGVDDVEQITASAARLIEDAVLRTSLIEQGLKMIQDYDWANIASRYYYEVYAPLMGTEIYD
ncbi:MAG: glycosyltransferase [Anaerolineae bacterium]|nr:MAG: glycosyltransferase [Anaerolineae bacterium]